MIENVEELIRQLNSASEPGIRNQLAMTLADSGDERGLEVLIALIKRPDLVNQRGTLVYCLGSFQYLDHVRLLIDLVIEGNWEVAYEASELLDSIEAPRNDDLSVGHEALLAARAGRIEGWRRELIDDLLALFL